MGAAPAEAPGPAHCRPLPHRSSAFRGRHPDDGSVGCGGPTTRFSRGRSPSCWSPPTTRSCRKYSPAHRPPRGWRTSRSSGSTTPARSTASHSSSPSCCPAARLNAQLLTAPLDPLAAVDLVADLATGVAAAHAVGLHGLGLTPKSVLFTATGAPRLTGIALARPPGTDRSTARRKRALDAVGLANLLVRRIDRPVARSARRQRAAAGARSRRPLADAATGARRRTARGRRGGRASPR